jgi:hypothetical protein
MNERKSIFQLAAALLLFVACHRKLKRLLDEAWIETTPAYKAKQQKSICVTKP